MDVDADWFRQALDHVLRAYGKASVRGLDDQGQERIWRSQDGGTVPMRARIESDEDVSEPPVDELVATFEGVDDDQILRADTVDLEPTEDSSDERPA